VLTAVRAFYPDIAEWADDPRWVPWAVRCPVSASEASHKKGPSHRWRALVVTGHGITEPPSQAGQSWLGRQWE
jgi:hypothetical protein